MMKNLVLKIVKIYKKSIFRVPVFINDIVFKIYGLYLIYSFKAYVGNNIKKRDYYAKANPLKIVQVNPREIKYHTLRDTGDNNSHFKDKVFDPWKDAGRILGGDWDKLEKKFTDLDAYKSFENHFKRGINWENTKFFQMVVKDIKSGRVLWGCSSKNELKDRFEKFDLLYENIKKFGYKSQKEIIENSIKDSFKGNLPKSLKINDEIIVNISRNGNLLFDNGRHRLSIAKILNIEKIPVRILVRHEKWQQFRDEVVKYIDDHYDGMSYNELPHPDFEDIQTHHNSKAIFNIIKNNLGFKTGKLLDVGSNLDGYFCHKFEKLGFECYAVENDPIKIYFLKKFRIINNQKFRIIDKSIFDFDIKGKKFNVVLALNVFHHFLQNKYSFERLLQLLKDLKTDELFLQCPIKGTLMLKSAYREYTEDQFAEFIIENSNLNYYKFLGRPEANDSPIYKLIK